VLVNYVVYVVENYVKCVVANYDILCVIANTIGNRLHSSIFFYSFVLRNINGLYSSIPKPINVSSTDEHRVRTFVG
jgi:hypothetical protein